MGSVYKADDKILNLTVAIKFLRPDLVSEESLLQRFRQEIRLARRIRHKNVCGIHEYGQHGDFHFIVMDYIEGSDLKSLLRSRPDLSTRDAFEIALQIADGLQAIHDAGIVHRDLKAPNIMVDAERTVHLMDFGIAVATDPHESVQITQAGLIVGTPEYMSPEQARGAKLDYSSDIYSFGVLLYELFTGDVPFQGGTPVAIIMRHLQDAPALDGPAMAGVPAAVIPILRRALEKEPAQRYASAADVRRALEEARASFEHGASTSMLPIPEFDTKTIPATSPPASAASQVPAGAGSSTLIDAEPVHPPTATRPAARPRRERRRVKTPVCIANRYTLHETIAMGRCGPFYRVYDSVRARLVGLKLITTADSDARERLLRGGRLWLDLKHQNLVKVLDVQPDCDGYAGIIVSELAEGVPLTDLLARPRLTLDQTLSLASQLCEALSYIHSKGIVHREVKPSNIIVSTESHRLTLLDSGIARHANPEIDAFTKTGIFVGDLSYCPPEMVEGQRIDERVDIYAAAAVVVEMLSGRRLEGGHAAVAQRASELASVPPRVRSVLARALDSDPDKRLGSAQEFADALQTVIPEKRAPKRLEKMVVTLHGIRTHARWQRAFVEVARDADLDARHDRWNFGYFSSIRFVLPWSRRAKVRWFRETYENEFQWILGGQQSLERPGIVAHSFGTYILGNALLRYPYLRFGKVLLCGSILPREFPWDRLIERGQVQAVRNEYGTEDVWTRIVDWFIPGTGPSGVKGFTVEHPRIEQERFRFSHSEFFERGHMETQWLPFLRHRIPLNPPQEVAVEPPALLRRPWGVYGVYAATMVVFTYVAVWATSWAASVWSRLFVAAK